MFVARVSELVRWNVKNGKVYAKSISVPLQGKARKTLGSVFGVIGGEIAPKTGDALVAVIEESFRNGLDDALLNLPIDATRDEIFEAALVSVNAGLAEVAAQGMIFAPDRIRAALVAQRGHDIVAGAWGEPCLLLIHPSPSSGAKIFDLLADTRSDREKALFDPTTRRSFGNLIAGTVGRRDRLVISTADLREILGPQKLMSVIVSNEPESATLVLRDILSPLNETLSIATVVSDAVPADAMAPTQPAPGYDRASQPAQVEQRQREASHHLSQASSTAKTFAAKAWAVVRSAFRMTVSGARTLANKEERGRVAASVKAAPGLRLNHAVQKFNGLPRRSQLLLPAVLSIILLLEGGITYANYRNQQRRTAENYTISLAAIEQLIGDAEGSLLYRDNERARQLLDEAVAKTSALVDGQLEERNTKERLLSKIEAKRIAQRRIVSLEAPDVAASVTMGGEQVSLVRLGLAGTTAWATTPKGDIFKISLADGVSEKIGSGPAASDLPIFLTLDSGVVSGSADGRMTIARTVGGAKPATIDFADETPSIKDAAIFSGRLYLLDPTRNRILRHSATAAGFGRGTFYLKDGTDVGSGVSLAVDGSVFVLSKDGSVVKLTKGLREEYAVERPEPAPTAARRIRTDAGQSGLYVFDADAGRLIAYEKSSGVLKAQYVNEALKTAEDVAVDEKSGMIYAVSGDRILKFSIPKN